MTNNPKYYLAHKAQSIQGSSGSVGDISFLYQKKFSVPEAAKLAGMGEFGKGTGLP